MNEDRVSQLYHGDISSKEAQRACKERIHWMIAQIQGDRVLDIGCSQGIAAILAGRAGKVVVGVDTSEAAIQYAQEALRAETAEVQSRVRFRRADLTTDDLEGATFETVLLGEVLQHHREPRRLLDRIVRFLEPGGRLVLSVPFGVAGGDAQATFYLSSLLAAVDGLAAPTALDVEDGHIRFVGVRPGGGPAASLARDDAALLARSEAAFEQKERAARNVDWELRLQREAAENRRLAMRITMTEERYERIIHNFEISLEREVSRNEKLREERGRLRDDVARWRAAAKKPRVLPSILPPPPEAGAWRRGLGMAFGSMQLEIHKGHAARRPDKALLRTFKRVRKAVRTPSRAKIAAEPEPVAIDSPEPVAEVPPAAPPVTAPPRTVKAPAPLFPPFQALVAPGGSPIKVATILDTFSEFCLRYAANLVPLSTRAWREEMEEHRPAFLLAESAWVGNGGQWQYLMTKYVAREVNPLRDLLAWCKRQGVPRVFWNKEDPANFDVFKDVAADFDHVFTTDEACIPRYRELLGHDRIHALPFAAQPAIHNPMQDAVERVRSVCFAGSWRAQKYPERAADTEALLAPALAFGLDIYDRNAGSKRADELAFPAPYRDAVRGSLDYDAMLTAYRAYKTFLNVNSVKESSTMFARRVFELMACGTPVVSSDSVGIREMLGTLVKIASTPEETRAHLARLLEDDDYRGRYAHAGYREVLDRHTYTDRFRTILDAVGIDAPRPATPLVTILTATNRPARLANLLSNLRRQIHPNLELIILLNADEYDPAAVEQEAADLPNLRVIRVPESHTLAECLNVGIDAAHGAWIAKFDDDDHYGAHYISDLLLATRYTDAPVLGKRCHFLWLEQTSQLVMRFFDLPNRHVEFVAGATLFVRRDVFDKVRFSPVKRGTDTVFQRDCRERGMNIYSADPYNFVVVRQGDAGTHTWQITDQQILARSRVIASSLDMGLVMI